MEEGNGRREGLEVAQVAYWVDVDLLIPYERNAKVHGSEVDILQNSIERYDFRNPIRVDRDNTIISGHGRLIAAKRLGRKRVPVIFDDDLTPEQVREFRLVDNQVSDLSGYDHELRSLELRELSEMGWDPLDFGFADLDFSLESTADVPYIEEIEEDMGVESIMGDGPGFEAPDFESGDVVMIGDLTILNGMFIDPVTMIAMVLDNPGRTTLVTNDPVMCERYIEEYSRVTGVSDYIVERDGEEFQRTV